MADKNGIVKANTKAYNYSYTSLSDIVKQDYKLPKMKTGTDVNGKDYIYYYDDELKDWLRGAEIIVPEMKGMNAAQKLGAGISFARRYTAMMALSLASSDDEKLEQMERPQPTNKSGIWDEPIEKPVENARSLKILADEFRKVVPGTEQERILTGLKYERAEDIGMTDLEKYINFYKYGKGKTNQS